MPARLHKNSKIASHECYATVVSEYNELLKVYGKVNNAKFFLENVQPRMPKVNRATWYRFIKGFLTPEGLTIPKSLVPTVPNSQAVVVVRDLEATIADNAQSTQRGIAMLLQIGAEAAQEVMNNPEALSLKDRLALLPTAMRAQDSRMFAVAAVRKERREEKAFQKAFDEAAYSREDDEDAI